MDREADRQLGPQMIAEGWMVTGGDWLMWMHPASKRSVQVRGPWRWEQTKGYVALHGRPSDPKSEGYIVGCERWDEDGEPVQGEHFWVDSYGEAVKMARQIRQSIVDERVAPTTHEQLLLAGNE